VKGEGELERELGEMGKFSLQRVLELKQRRELAMAGLLAQARTAADQARRSEAEIEAAREQDDTERLAISRVVNRAGVLMNMAYLTRDLDQRLEPARTAVRSADRTVDERLADFHLALRERRALDRLREKRMEAVSIEEERVDQAATDEVAIMRFTRTDGNQGAEE
jgi:flagellar export protein FliJ